MVHLLPFFVVLRNSKANSKPGKGDVLRKENVEVKDIVTYVYNSYHRRFLLTFCRRLDKK